MNEENEDNQESLNPEEENEETSKNTSEESETSEDSQEDVEVLKKKAKLAENYKIRAEKAEKELKAKKSEKPQEEKVGLSELDIFALVKANVSEEDLDEVKNFAGYRKISVAEALKDKTLKSILSDRAEERRSAEATETKGQRPSSQTSPEAVLAKASRGELPEKDEDIEALAKARIEAKLK